VRRLAVDASVGAKWLLEERGSPEASLLLHPDIRLCAPALFYDEVISVLWKSARRGRIPRDEALLKTTELLDIDMESADDRLVAPSALEMALATGHPPYDCVYAAVAVAENAPLVTADDRLVDAMRRFGLGDYVVPLVGLSAFLGDGAGGLG
jgi:predicted nucleic acid-binding protein